MPCQEQGDRVVRGNLSARCHRGLGSWFTLPALPMGPHDSSRNRARVQRHTGGVGEGLADGNRQGPQDTNLPPPSDYCTTIYLFCFLN